MGTQAPPTQVLPVLHSAAAVQEAGQTGADWSGAPLHPMAW
jgi:hypothetical protein